MEKSFTTVTRLELSKRKFTKENHLLAELAAFSFSSGSIKLGRGALSLQLTSENEEIILRIASIIKRLYKNQPEIRAVEKNQPKKHTVFTIDIVPGSPEGQLLFEIGLLEGTDEDYSFGTINKKVFELDGCFESALRGAFLGCGVLCDPEKSYRLEFVLSHEEFSEFLFEKLIEMGIVAKNIQRRERNVIYIEQIEYVSDTLILMGATNAMMQIENISVNKAVKNKMNRSGNCIVANIDKAVTAAQKQIDDINVLLKANVKFSKSLKEACDLRLNNPEASLAELAQISGKTTKSALNKRFIKIRQMREEMEL